MKTQLNNIGKQIISDVLLKLNLEIREYGFSINPSQDFGDYSTNVAFLYSKLMNKKPQEIAKIIADEISMNTKTLNFFEKVVAEDNGYINFWTSKSYLSKNIDYINRNSKPFFGFLGKDSRKYIIEFSSPNMVKTFTIGYLRSTIIGDSVSKIFSYSGKDIIRDNHLGDWGVQFGKIICAVQEFSSIEKIKSMDDPYLEILSLYRSFRKQEILYPLLSSKADDYFLKLESGDEEVLLLWSEVRNILYKELSEIYSLLGVSFDVISWESDVRDSVQDLIDQLILVGIAKESNGAVIIDLEEDNLSKMVLRKQNGSALYGSRELATDKSRILKYGTDIVIINEVGSDQEMYLRQIYLIEERLLWFQKHQRHHLSHGMYRLDGMKEDSVNDNYLELVTVIEQISKQYQSKYEISKKNAIDLAIGAMRLHDFKNPHINNIDFNLDLFLQDNVDTIFYVQRLMKKISSILADSSSRDYFFDANKCSVFELSLCRKLEKFPQVLEFCINGIQCTTLARYLLELLSALDIVLLEKDTNENKRSLLESTNKILNLCFDLLGIKII